MSESHSKPKNYTGKAPIYYIWDEPRFYSAAQYCSRKRAAIEQAIHDGTPKAIRIGRGCVITRESIGKLFDARDAIEPHIPASILARRAARAVNAAPALGPKRRLRDEHKESQRRAEVGGQSVRQHSQ
jgi:hypothetical protein